MGEQGSCLLIKNERPCQVRDRKHLFEIKRKTIREALIQAKAQVAFR